MSKLGDETSQAETMAHLAACMDTLADFEAAAVDIERAFTYPVTPRVRVQLLLDRVWQRMAIGDWPQSVRDLDTALTIIEQTGDLRALRIVSTQFRSQLAVLPGATEQVERLRRLAERHLGEQVSPAHAELSGVVAAAELGCGCWSEALA